MRWAQEERGLLLVGNPGGALYANGPRTAAAMKARGCGAGAPDLLVLRRGIQGHICLAVEFKIGTNQPSALQRAWGDRAEKEGVKYVVVRSEPEFRRAIDVHIGHPDAAGCGEPTQCHSL